MGNTRIVSKGSGVVSKAEVIEQKKRYLKYLQDFVISFRMPSPEMKSMIMDKCDEIEKLQLEIHQLEQEEN